MNFQKISFLSLIITIVNFEVHANNTEFNKNFPKTTLKGDLFLTIGSVKSDNLNESFQMTYENKIKINTNFNNKHKLFTVIESGNAMNSPLNFDLQSKKGDNLQISTLFYSLNLRDDTRLILGPKMFGYYGLAGKSSDYNERYAILDGTNFTTSTGNGPGLSISSKRKNGFNTSIKIASNKSTIDKETVHFINQIGLTKKHFGGTITRNINNKFNAYGISVYIKPPSLPSISASIENKKGKFINSTTNWMIGLQKKYNNKTFGIAKGTYNSLENICYELWSEIELKSNLKIIPIFFKKESNKNSKSDFGFGINTKFSY